MKKPRVLMLTPWAPFPLDAGSRRVWSACKHLQDRYRFNLLTFFNPRTSYSGVEQPNPDPALNTAVFLRDEHRYLRDVFESVDTVSTDYRPDLAEPPEGEWLPDDVRRFCAPAMREEIARTIRRRKIDLVHVEFDLMAPYVHWIRRDFPGLPVVMTQHDMGSVSLFRSYFREMADWRRFLRLGPWWRRLVFTRRFCGRFDAVVTLTERDGARLRRLIPSGKVHVVPTGVDLEHFSDSAPREAREPASLVYVGHYPHYPNEDAVLWFSREILPRIWARSPEAKFYVVGSHPTPPLLTLARGDRRIVVTGTVEDVKPYESRAMAMVAPIRLGQGIKGKLLEAFAVGTPVVATRCANEGVRAAPERHLLVADRPADFAEQALRLLQDAELWRRLSSGAREFVTAEHSWRRRADGLDALYRKILLTAPADDTTLVRSP